MMMMMFVYTLLFLPLIATTDTAQVMKNQDDARLLKITSRNAFDWVTDGFLNVVDALLPVSRSCTGVEARKKKKHKLNKYVLPLIVGFLLIKSILLPIALKALAVLSGKAVVLSLMSLILAAIVGLKKVAQSSTVTNVSPSKYRRQDLYDFTDDFTGESDPYRFYKERRRKK